MMLFLTRFIQSNIQFLVKLCRTKRFLFLLFLFRLEEFFQQAVNDEKDFQNHNIALEFAR